jgi:hypothetical protein
MLIQRLAVRGEKTRHVPYKYRALGRKKKKQKKRDDRIENRGDNP